MRVVPYLPALALILCSAGAQEPPSPPPNAAIVSLMHRAAEERRQGAYQEASETYRQIVRLAPRMFEAHLFLADTLRKRQLDGEAEPEFRTAREIKPEDPLPHVGLAEMKRERFRFSEALSLLDEGMRAVPPDRREPLIVAKASILRQRGDPAGALTVLAEGAKRFPESARIPESVARSLEEQGRLGEALEAWQRAAVRSPDNVAVGLELKEAQRLASRLAEAEAAAAKPGAGEGAWRNLARLRWTARQFPGAVTAAEAVLRRQPKSSELLLLRGLALERAGQREEAEAAFARIDPQAPEDLLALFHRAYLARLAGKGAAEEKLWRAALERHPRDGTAALMLVLGWKRNGILEERIATLRQGSGRGRGDARGRRILEGTALEEAGRDAEALAVYERLFLEEPRDPESAARLSGLLSLHPALLKQRLEEESAGPPGKPSTPGPGRSLLRSQLLLAAGRTQAAVDELKEAATIFPEREEVLLALASLSGLAATETAEIAILLDRAAASFPRSPWTQLERGLFRLQRGDFEGAIAEGREVIRLAPALPEGHQLLAAASRLGEDPGKAMEELRTSLLLDPADSPGVVKFQKALILAAGGERREAQAALEGEMPIFPELTYRLAWTFVRRTFLDRTFRGQDWLAWRDRFDDPAAAPETACAAVAEMLASLRDPYTRLRGKEETASLFLKPRSGKLETDVSGAPSRASASVVAGDLGENFGYIRLTNLTDPSARESIRRALQEMAERDGLVLDLRGNLGGMASEADAIAGLLLAPGEELGRERTRFGEQVQRTPETGPGGSRKPLVILTDRRTGSAAEKLASGLQGAGRATVLGDETFGKGVGQMSRLLPGGVMVLVTAVESLTRTGGAIEGKGVVPDVPGEDVSLEKAKELLRQPNPQRR
ncbi:MAG TPA: S41 family peptidase [Candidatus Polarisedimenticolia bacterium]|nr:S41 family peptidase [Candidatus Polarisedimenticolia bacterium]